MNASDEMITMWLDLNSCLFEKLSHRMLSRPTKVFLSACLLWYLHICNFLFLPRSDRLAEFISRPDNQGRLLFFFWISLMNLDTDVCVLTVTLKSQQPVLLITIFERLVVAIFIIKPICDLTHKSWRNFSRSFAHTI